MKNLQSSRKIKFSLFKADASPAACERTLAPLLALLFLLLFNPSVWSQADKGGNAKIVGGQQIDIEDAPWQVSVEWNGNHHCGGIILSRKWILTAAHCTADGPLSADFFDPDELIVHAGATNQTQNSQGQRIEVVNIIRHPLADWNQWGVADLALLELENPLELGSGVQPISIYNSCNGQFYGGSPITLTGWGCITTPPNPPATCSTVANLREVTVAVDFVSNTYFNIEIEDQKGASRGDSGGPGVIDGWNSYGPLCAGIGSDAGTDPFGNITTQYINLGNYYDWIDNQLAGEVDIAAPRYGVDLFIQDDPYDIGYEPGDLPEPWHSEAIWVRNNNDTNQNHQDPEYTPNQPVYVKVKLKNRGCFASTTTSNTSIEVYWAKASTALTWPNHWNGSITSPALMGDQIGTQPVPVLNIGEEHTFTFSWQPPNPATYADIGDDDIFVADAPHHFCLMARVVSDDDPVQQISSDMTEYSRNNNNVAWTNFTIVDDISNSPPENNDGFNNGGNVGGSGSSGGGFGGGSGVSGGCKRLDGGNVFVGAVKGGELYHFKFKVTEKIEDAFFGNIQSIITLEAPLWKAWQKTGARGKGIRILDKEKHQIEIVSNKAGLFNIFIEPGSFNRINYLPCMYGPVDVGRESVDFDIVQTTVDGRPIGGERFRFNPAVFKEFEQEEQVEEDPVLTISPNPVRDQLVVRFGELTGGELMIVDAKTMQTQLSLNVNEDEQVVEIEVPSFESGLYLLIYYAEDGRKYVEPFIKL